MRFVRYDDDGSVGWGALRDDAVHRLGTFQEGDPTLSDVGNPGYRSAVKRDIDAGALPTVERSAVDLLAPVPRPGKIVCVGLNYHDHAEEQGEDPPESPLLFGKAPTCVTDPGKPIVHPPDIEQVDYEVELAVVMGRTAHRVSADDARDYVAGYTVCNDVSARDAQFDDGQFFRGKSYDTFAPLGPAIVAEGAVDPGNLDVACRVNGEVKQASSTAEFIFGVDELVEYISHAMTLRPGDVISTGTPGGVGIFRDPPELLEPGDTVEVEVEGIGTLRNPVVDAE